MPASVIVSRHVPIHPRPNPYHNQWGTAAFLTNDGGLVSFLRKPADSKMKLGHNRSDTDQTARTKGDKAQSIRRVQRKGRRVDRSFTGLLIESENGMAWLPAPMLPAGDPIAD